MKGISWFTLLATMSLFYISACKKNSQNGPAITFKTYPNPADTVLFVETQPVSQSLNWQLTDVLGKQLMQGSIIGGRYELNTRALKSGTYVLVMSRQDNAKDKVSTTIGVLH